MIAELKKRYWRPGSASRGLVVAAMWSLPLRFFGMGLGFVVGVLLARMLGPAELGIYGVVLALAMILMALAQLGLPTLAVRELMRFRAIQDWGGLRGLLRWSAFVSAGVGALLGIGLVSAVLFLPTVSTAFLGASLWAAPLIPIMALTILLNAELRTFGRLVGGQSLEIVLRPAGMAALLVAAWLAGRALSPASAMAINLVASLVAMAVGFYWMRGALPLPARVAPPVYHKRAWLRAGMPLAATDILRQVDAAYGVLVMGIVTTAADTGIFRVAMSCVVIVATPLSIFHVVLAPTLARLHFQKDHDGLQQLARLTTLLMFGATAAATIAVALFGRWLIIVLFGADYAGAWLPLLILSIGQCIGALFGFASVLLGVAEGERELARSFLFSVAASVAAAVPLAYWWGSPGVAAASIVALLVNNGLASHYVRRRHGVDTTPFAWIRSE